jgi:hypothetical protein
LSVKRKHFFNQNESFFNQKIFTEYSIYFDVPVKWVYVNSHNAICNDKSRKWWELHKRELKKGVQTLKIKWINYDDTEGSHSITVKVVE